MTTRKYSLNDREIKSVCAKKSAVEDIAKLLADAGEIAKRHGLFIFGGGGGGMGATVRVHDMHPSNRPLVLATIPGPFDGGCGASCTLDGLERGE